MESSGRHADQSQDGPPTIADERQTAAPDDARPTAAPPLSGEPTQPLAAAVLLTDADDADEANAERGTPRGQRLMLANGLLLTLLSGQLAYLTCGIDWTATPGAEPLLAWLVERGIAPAPTRLERIAVPHLQVGTATTPPASLQVLGQLHNEAAFAQPLPRLRLVFSDTLGRTKAGIDLAPADYLNYPPPSNTDAVPLVSPPVLAGGQSIDFRALIEDPGTALPTYELRLLPP